MLILSQNNNLKLKEVQWMPSFFHCIKTLKIKLLFLRRHVALIAKEMDFLKRAKEVNLQVEESLKMIKQRKQRKRKTIICSQLRIGTDLLNTWTKWKGHKMNHQLWIILANWVSKLESTFQNRKNWITLTKMLWEDGERMFRKHARRVS